jgi:hypothetical protein
MFAEIIPGKSPCQYPESAPDCVKQQKSPPVHLQGPRHHAVELTKNVEETRECNGEWAVPRKDCLDLAQALRSNSDLVAVTQDNNSALLPVKYPMSRRGPRRFRQRASANGNDMLPCSAITEAKIGSDSLGKGAPSDSSVVITGTAISPYCRTNGSTSPSRCSISVMNAALRAENSGHLS